MSLKLRFSENGFVHICGHRGYSEGAPENTIAALEAAHRNGATTCEVDALLSADGEIVLMHDHTVDRTTNGQGLVQSLSLKQIRQLDAGSWFSAAHAGEGVPTLEEALIWAKGKLHLWVEIKEYFRLVQFIERLREVLEATQSAKEMVILSFDHRALLEVKTQLPDVLTEAILHERLVDPVATLQAAKVDSVSLELEMFDIQTATAIHRAGIAIRCHLPRPRHLNHFKQHGLDVEPQIKQWIAAGHIDNLSGDDVVYLKNLTLS